MGFLKKLNLKAFCHLVCLYLVSLLSVRIASKRPDQVETQRLDWQTFNREGSLYLVCSEKREF